MRSIRENLNFIGQLRHVAIDDGDKYSGTSIMP